MERNLFDFGDEKLSNNESQRKKEKNVLEEKELEKEVFETYEKYKDYSQDDLMKEFLTASRDKINNGSLSQEKLKDMVSLLRPYIDNNQEEFLNNLIKKIDD